MADRDSLRPLLERALAGKLVAIVRLRRGERLLEVATALVAGGIRTLEFTLTTPAALDAIGACRVHLGDEVIVGAGSVLDESDARRSLDAGAQFLVSPGFDAAVVEAAHTGCALAMPGALTPTEILAAWRAGADVVKVFPARAFGPSYIKDLLAPLPQIPLMPTGGVGAENAAAYLRAGAVAVAVGGSLIDPDAVATADWAAISAQARALVAAVGEA